MNEDLRKKADMVLSEDEMERVSGGSVAGCQYFWVCECGAEYAYVGNTPPAACGRCGNRDLGKFSLESRYAFEDYDTPL
jgi:hypothetical protein